MSHTQSVRRHFTPPQIAEDLGVAVEKVTAWIGQGELPAINVANRGSKRPRYRISLEAYEAFKRARAVIQPPPAPSRPLRRKAAVAATRNYFE